MRTPPESPAALLDAGAGPTCADPRELLLGYLDFFREAALRKLDGLTDAQLRTPLEPMGWAPLGVLRHLGWVEHRWIRWGFRAEDVDSRPDGDAEWTVPAGVPAADVVAEYWRRVAETRAIMTAAELTDLAGTGGRFRADEPPPPLVRILFHLLQEYARHVGQLDIARELVDGATGE